MKLAIPVKMNKEDSAIAPLFGKANTQRGVFSTRIPLHPNKMGLSGVDILGARIIDLSCEIFFHMI